MAGLPVALVRLLPRGVGWDLSAEQARVVSEAWRVDSDALRRSLLAVERADRPVGLLVAIAKRLVADGVRLRVGAAAQRARAVQGCGRVYDALVADGESHESARDYLLGEYRRDPSIVEEAIPE